MLRNEELPKNGVPVVYAIKNKVTGKEYIGSTDKADRRCVEHKSGLNTDKHFNERMKMDCKEQGLDSFEFEVVEVVSDINELGKRERDICIARNTFANGYNQKLPSAKTLNRDIFRCLEHRSKMSLLAQNAVELIVLCGEKKTVLQKFNSITDAADFYQIEYSILCSKCNENSNRLLLDQPLLCIKGKVFLRAEDYKEGMEIRVSEASLNPHGQWDTRPVTAENPKTGEVRDYASVRQASIENNVQQLSIYGALKTGHKCHGFYWKDSGRK